MQRPVTMSQRNRLRGEIAPYPEVHLKDGYGYPIYGSTTIRYWPENCPIWKVLAPGEDFPHRAWADHQMIENHDGNTVYVCHPYQLHTEDFKDLVKLSTAGFRIRVDGQSAYYPGNAVRVEIAPER